MQHDERDNSLRSGQRLGAPALLLRVDRNPRNSRELVQGVHQTREVVWSDELLGGVGSNARQDVKRLPRSFGMRDS